MSSICYGYAVSKLKIFFLLLFFPVLVYGQHLSDSLLFSISDMPVNRLFSIFDKQLNTYYLNTGIDYSGISSPFQFEINQSFRSTLVRSITNSIRDENNLRLIARYKLSSNFSPGAAITSSILSDDRQLAINQSVINKAIIFTEFNTNNQINVIPYGGLSDNKQVGENDLGPIYGFEASGRNLDFTDFTINSAFRFENEDISPRKNLLRFFGLDVTNPFNPEVSNFIYSTFRQSRKDFYFPADSIVSSQFNISNNIESRTETTFALNDRLLFNRLLKYFSAEISGRINLRNIDRDTRYRSPDVQNISVFDTQVDEFIIGLESGLNFNSGFADALLRLSYFERDEKHITERLDGIDETFYQQRSELESSKNNNSGRTTISLAGNLHLSRKDNLALSLFHSKLKYDTPSADNDDDRDEILSILRMRYSRFLSHFLEAFINAEGTISHVVYLFASRSANNNINRVLRLAMGSNYRGADFSSLNNFEVSANYTVYDFEDLTSNLRSISFRQFTATDSSHLRISRNFSFIVTGYVKLTDQGELDWGEFAERPKRHLQEIFADPKLGLVFSNAFFALGMRYFSLKTFNYKEEKRIPDSQFLSIGPLFELSIGSNSLYLKINSWYEFLFVDDNPDAGRLNLILAMNWKF